MESYILEPYVVGDQVDLHPYFVIRAVIIGNSTWGVAGMVVSIPVLAMINECCTHQCGSTPSIWLSIKQKNLFN